MVWIGSTISSIKPIINVSSTSLEIISSSAAVILDLPSAFYISGAQLEWSLGSWSHFFKEPISLDLFGQTTSPKRVLVCSKFLPFPTVEGPWALADLQSSRNVSEVFSRSVPLHSPVIWTIWLDSRVGSSVLMVSTLILSAIMDSKQAVETSHRWSREMEEPLS